MTRYSIVWDPGVRQQIALMVLSFLKCSYKKKYLIYVFKIRLRRLQHTRGGYIHTHISEDIYPYIDDTDLHHALDLEESFQVVNLTDGHQDEDKGLERGPQDDTRVGALVDRAMNLVAHLK